MKYWRGYLTAAIIACISLGLTQFAKAHTVLIDMVYPYVTRMLQSFLAGWSSGAAFCLWQLGVAVLAVGLLASIVLMILLRWNPIQWFGWVLSVVSLVVLLHTGVYGLNYYAGPLADDIRLTVTPYTAEELGETTAYYRDKANALSAEVQRDGDGNVVYPEFSQLAEQAGEGFRVLTYEKFMPIFAGSTIPVKKLGWADWYTSAGYTGVTMPITGEAAVNPNIPPVSMPFTMCHEMAHRMCIAIEQDANMAAFLASEANPSPEFQYSAYFMAYYYCASALRAVRPQLAAEVGGALSPELRHDLDNYTAFWRSTRDENASKVADTVNDAYLKASGDENGLASYGNVCDLLVSWHIQTVVLPAKEEEAESKFDPLDKNQVDLTGLARAG